MNDPTIDEAARAAHLEKLVAERRRRNDQVFDAMAHESDRGLILVAAAYFDGAMEELLRATINKAEMKSRGLVDPLFDAFGPLSSYAGKVRIARAFDLLPEWLYGDLELIRKMRNLLAHTSEALSLGREPMLGLIDQLRSFEFTPSGEKYLQAREQAIRDTRAERAERAAAEKPRIRLEFCITHMGAVMDSMIVVQATGAPTELLVKIGKDLGRKRDWA